MWIQYPLLALLLLIVILWLVTFVLRIRAIQAKNISVSDMFSVNRSAFPVHLRLLGNNYDNQFQQPVLFMLGLFALELDALAGPFWYGCAAVFVVARYWHSYEHVVRRDLLKRTLAFTLGTLSLLALWSNYLFYLFALSD